MRKTIYREVVDLQRKVSIRQKQFSEEDLQIIRTHLMRVREIAGKAENWNV